jgi:hypothetical protein
MRAIARHKLPHAKLFRQDMAAFHLLEIAHSIGNNQPPFGSSRSLKERGS